MFRNWSPMRWTGLVLGVVAVVLVVLVVAESEEEDSAVSDNGLGKHITWHTLMDGLGLAKEEGKPLMLIIHKSWCGACKSLKPKFRESPKIAKLSKNFIMVNTMDDDEPPGDMYKPDGGYVPRLFFFNPEGDLLEDITNEDGNPKYKYYYYDALSIVTAMEKVAALYPASGDGDDEVNANEDKQSDRNQEKIEL